MGTRHEQLKRRPLPTSPAAPITIKTEAAINNGSAIAPVRRMLSERTEIDELERVKILVGGMKILMCGLCWKL